MCLRVSVLMGGCGCARVYVLKNKLKELLWCVICHVDLFEQRCKNQMHDVSLYVWLYIQ